MKQFNTRNYFLSEFATLENNKKYPIGVIIINVIYYNYFVIIKYYYYHYSIRHNYYECERVSRICFRYNSTRCCSTREYIIIRSEMDRWFCSVIYLVVSPNTDCP